MTFFKHYRCLTILIILQFVTTFSFGSMYKPRRHHVVPLPYARGSPILNRKMSSLDSNRPLPCCKDESGGSICRTMKANDLKEFSKKCATEPDFSLVVCCKSCSETGDSYRDRAHKFFSQGNSTNCFDRMSTAYCSKFERNTDAWSAGRWSCHTSHFRLAFRVCRATCGFCSLDWKNAPDPAKCI